MIFENKIRFDNIFIEDASSHRRLMGGLIYLTNIRPNITYAIQHLSQFVL